MKAGTFRYLDNKDSPAYFSIQGNQHKEHHQQGKYTIESEPEWLDDCRYRMTMKRNTFPSFPFKPGDRMTVTLLKVEGNILYYKAEAGGDPGAVPAKRRIKRHTGAAE